MKFIAKLSIWLSCALLYVFQVSPLLFRLESAKRYFGANNASSSQPTDVIVIVGVIIMAIGILLESLADWQKSRAKKKNPNPISKNNSSKTSAQKDNTNPNKIVFPNFVYFILLFLFVLIFRIPLPHL